MSFSLHFHTCNLGTETRDATNPFTGEKTVFHIDEGLTKSERQATIDLLTSFSATEPDPDGYYYLDTSDGARVGVGAPTLATADKCVAFAVECDKLTPEAAAFLLRLSQASNTTIGSAIHPDVVAFTSQPNAQLLERWPNSPYLDSSDAARRWLQAECN